MSGMKSVYMFSLSYCFYAGLRDQRITVGVGWAIGSRRMGLVCVETL